MMTTVRHSLDRLAAGLAALSGVLFLGVFLFTMINIVSRNVGGVALQWIPGITRLSFVWSVFLAASVLYRSGDHLVVDYVLQKAGPRVSAGLRLAVDVITLPFFVLVIINGLRIARVRMRISYETWDFPTGYAYLALPICAAVMLVFNAERLVSNRPQGDPHNG